jgi:hypothetical protein
VGEELAVELVVEIELALKVALEGELEGELEVNPQGQLAVGEALKGELAGELEDAGSQDASTGEELEAVGAEGSASARGWLVGNWLQTRQRPRQVPLSCRKADRLFIAKKSSRKRLHLSGVLY